MQRHRQRRGAVSLAAYRRKATALKVGIERDRCGYALTVVVIGRRGGLTTMRHEVETLEQLAAVSGLYRLLPWEDRMLAVTHDSLGVPIVATVPEEEPERLTGGMR